MSAGFPVSLWLTKISIAPLMFSECRKWAADNSAEVCTLEKSVDATNVSEFVRVGNAPADNSWRTGWAGQLFGLVILRSDTHLHGFGPLLDEAIVPFRDRRTVVRHDSVA